MSSDKDRVGEEVVAAIKQVLDRNKIATDSSRKAPIHAHKILDALMATERDPNRGAPGWAHAALDFIWDLLF